MSVQDDIFDLESHLGAIKSKADRTDARRCFRSMLKRLEEAERCETQWIRVTRTLADLKSLWSQLP